MTSPLQPPLNLINDALVAALTASVGSGPSITARNEELIKLLGTVRRASKSVPPSGNAQLDTTLQSLESDLLSEMTSVLLSNGGVVNRRVIAALSMLAQVRDSSVAMSTTYVDSGSGESYIVPDLTQLFNQAYGTP